MKHSTLITWDKKWNFKSRIIDKSGKRADLKFAKKMQINPDKDIYEVRDLKLTNKEKIYINALQEAFKHIFKCYNLPIFHIPTRCIHIISEYQFNKKVKVNSDEYGKASYGHAYIIRNKKRFLGDLAHEMAHLAGYFHQTINITADNKYIYTMKQGGLVKQPYLDIVINSGINEAITEQLAFEAIKICENNNSLPKKITKQYRQTAYIPQLMVLNYVLKKVSKTKKEARSNFSKLMKGYLTGKIKYIKEIFKDEKLILLINGMGRSQNDAIAIAYMLKNYKLCHAIQNL